MEQNTEELDDMTQLIQKDPDDNTGKQAEDMAQLVEKDPDHNTEEQAEDMAQIVQKDPDHNTEEEIEAMAQIVQKLTLRPSIEDLVIGVFIEFHTEDPLTFHSTMNEQMITADLFTSVRGKNRALGICITMTKDNPVIVPIAGVVQIYLRLYDKGSGSFEYGILAESYDFSNDGDEPRDISCWLEKINENNKRVRWDTPVDADPQTDYPSKKQRCNSDGQTDLKNWKNRLRRDKLCLEMDVEPGSKEKDECTLKEIYVSLHIHETPLYTKLQECIHQFYDALSL